MTMEDIMIIDRHLIDAIAIALTFIVENSKEGGMDIDKININEDRSIDIWATVKCPAKYIEIEIETKLTID